MDNVNNFFIRIKKLRDKFIEVLRQLSSPQWNLQPLIDLVNRNYDQLMELRQLDEKQCLNALYEKCTRPLLTGKYLGTRSITGIIDLLSGFNQPEPTFEDRYWRENDLIGIDENGVIRDDRVEIGPHNDRVEIGPHNDRVEIGHPDDSIIDTQVENSKYTSEELLLIGVVLTQLATPEILVPIWDQLTLITNCSKLIYQKMECAYSHSDYKIIY